MQQTGIYKIWHIKKPNIFYIGATTNSLRKRILCHMLRLRKNSHYNKHLQNVVKKYGIAGIRYEYIELLPNISYNSLGILEDCYIQLYKRIYGKVYNVYLYKSSITFGSKNGRCNITNHMKNNNPMFNQEISDKAHATRKRLHPASKIRQYTKNGELFKIWNNSEEAASENKIDVSNISRACKDNKLCKNYIFFYDHEFSEDKLKLKVEKLSKRRCKSRVLNIYPHTGLIIKTYESCEDASRCYCVDESNISRAASGKSKSCAGYIWIYENEFTDELVQEKLDKFFKRVK